MNSNMTQYNEYLQTLGFPGAHGKEFHIVHFNFLK